MNLCKDGPPLLFSHKRGVCRQWPPSDFIIIYQTINVINLLNNNKRINGLLCVCWVPQSCLANCKPMDYILPGSSVMEFSRQECWSGLPLHCSNGLVTFDSVQFRSFAKFWFSSVAKLCLTLSLFVTPWTAAHQASLFITNFRSLLKLRSIKLVMPSNHLILCCPLLLWPSIFPSIMVFSNEQVLLIRCPNISLQDWFPLGLTVVITLQIKGLSRVFSNTTVQKHQFFGAQLPLYSNSHIHTWLLEKP